MLIVTLWTSFLPLSHTAHEARWFHNPVISSLLILAIQLVEH